MDIAHQRLCYYIVQSLFDCDCRKIINYAILVVEEKGKDFILWMQKKII